MTVWTDVVTELMVEDVDKSGQDIKVCPLAIIPPFFLPPFTS